MLSPPHDGGRLLEIGCGAGVFLRTMSDLGWNATGIDFSPFAIEEARRNAPRATLHLGTLETAALQGPYDRIVMKHVLEHVTNPVECFERCRDLLAPSGVLCIAVPNIDSVEAAVFARFWMGLDVPRHLLHFRERVLVRFLERFGFEIEHVRPQLMPSTLSESLLLLLPEHLRRRVLGSWLAHALYLLLIFPAAVSYSLGNRPALEVRARKRPRG